MSRTVLLVLVMLLALALAPTAVLAQQDTKTEPAQTQPSTPTPAPAPAEQPQPEAQTTEDGKLIAVPGGKALGMSILGNQEAPKALVIVPWKRSELGNALGISTLFDDSKQPIDKEVFMRMLSYYEIKTNSSQATSAASGRKK
jgi:hypothetical protein